MFFSILEKKNVCRSVNKKIKKKSPYNLILFYFMGKPDLFNGTINFLVNIADGL